MKFNTACGTVGVSPWVQMSGIVLLFSALAAPALASAEVSVGAAGGGAFWVRDSPDDGLPGFGGAVSPLLSAQFDPWPGTVRPVLGVTSAPTFVYSEGYDAYTAPLLVADLGLTVGDEVTHFSLAGHAGLISFGAGVRITHLPWELGEQVQTGFELRATWLARWGGYASAAWTVRFGQDR